MERIPTPRRRYAEALLRSEIGAVRPLFGSSWRGREALKTRIAALALAKPSMPRIELGLDIVGLFLLAAFFTSWIGQLPVRNSPDVVESYGGLHIQRAELPQDIQARFAR